MVQGSPKKNLCVTNINLGEEGIGKCQVRILTVRNRPSWDKSTTRKMSMLMIQRGKKYNYT